MYSSEREYTRSTSERYRAGQDPSWHVRDKNDANVTIAPTGVSVTIIGAENKLRVTYLQLADRPVRGGDNRRFLRVVGVGASGYTTVRPLTPTPNPLQ